MGIHRGQLEQSAQDSLDAAEATITAVETRNTSGAITAADNGKILYTSVTGPTTLTLAPGIPEGFEITVIADADAGVILQPASGYTMSDSTVQYLTVDSPVVSPKLALGSSTLVGVANWKLVGTKWVHVAGSGWGEQP